MTLTQTECEYVDNEDDTREEEPGIVSDEDWQVAILVGLETGNMAVSDVRGHLIPGPSRYSQIAHTNAQFMIYYWLCQAR